MIVEFQIIQIDEEKEAKDKEKAENLQQEYDASELEESSICRYSLNLSYPIISIAELETEYKSIKVPAVKVLTTMVQTSYLLISYDDFVGLIKQIDKNFNILAPSKIYNKDGDIISSDK